MAPAENPMTVAEMLELPSFATAQVLAGCRGLDREVTSAMVLEAPDVENWSRRGQAILTSWFALQDLDEQQIEDFFERLVLVGTSALIFKRERFMEEPPEQIRELCDRCSIPLIAIDGDTKYEPILVDVLGHVIDSNLTLLNRFFEVHRHVMELSLAQPSLPQILQTLKGMVGSDATFYDQEQERRVGTDEGLLGFEAVRLTRLEPEQYRTHDYYEAKLAGADGTEREATAVRVPGPDGTHYLLIVHRTWQALASIDIMAVENIAYMLSLEIVKQEAIEQRLFLQANNAMHDLLLDRYGTHERIDAALQSLGIDEFPNYQVLLVRATLENPSEGGSVDDVLQAVRRKLRALWPGMAYYLINDRIIFVHSYQREKDGLSLERVQGALDDVHASPGLPAFTHLAALSRSSDRYGIGTRNKEVMDIYRLFDGNRWKDHCIRYENLGIYRLFLQMDDKSMLYDYLDRRVRELHESNPELMDTLIALCENDCNYKETAKRLYLHPKTVHYRVDRAQELSGLDVHDPDDHLQILLAGKIFSIADPAA